MLVQRRWISAKAGTNSPFAASGEHLRQQFMRAQNAFAPAYEG
jgi:hypothetical protein